MIKRVFSPSEMSQLPQKSIEAQKIRAILLAYGTEYDFCRFYRSENFFLGGLNGSFVLCEIGDGDLSELAEFLNINGFCELFCSGEAKEKLYGKLNSDYKKLNLMEYCGKPISRSVEVNPDLQGFYSVLSTSFQIDFEPWYLDMSHRVRHGVVQLRRLEQSVLAIQHNLNGEALLSQIATAPEYRGSGYASELISSVCEELRCSRIFVLCEDDLSDFYKRIGFVFRDNKYQFGGSHY